MQPFLNISTFFTILLGFLLWSSTLLCHFLFLTKLIYKSILQITNDLFGIIPIATDNFPLIQVVQYLIIKLYPPKNIYRWTKLLCVPTDVPHYTDYKVHKTCLTWLKNWQTDNKYLYMTFGHGCVADSGISSLISR